MDKKTHPRGEMEKLTMVMKKALVTTCYQGPNFMAFKYIRCMFVVCMRVRWFQAIAIGRSQQVVDRLMNLSIDYIETINRLLSGSSSQAIFRSVR